MPNVTEYVISKNWTDLPSKTTPINAVDLTHIETGIKNVTDFVNTLDTEDGLVLSEVPFTQLLLTKLNGIEAQANKYVLPTASSSTLGGVKVDNETVTIDNNGVIHASGSGSSSFPDYTDTMAILNDD